MSVQLSIIIGALSIFHFLAWGLTRGPNFTKGKYDLLITQLYHLQNLIALCQPMTEISITKDPAEKNRQTKNSK